VRQQGNDRRESEAQPGGDSQLVRRGRHVSFPTRSSRCCTSLRSSCSLRAAQGRDLLSLKVCLTSLTPPFALPSSTSPSCLSLLSPVKSTCGLLELAGGGPPTTSNAPRVRRQGPPAWRRARPIARGPGPCRFIVDDGAPARPPRRRHARGRPGRRAARQAASWRAASRAANVESTFSAVKRKFGASVRSKNATAQTNGDAVSDLTAEEQRNMRTALGFLRAGWTGSR
jgi:hypothetical protein